MHSGEKIRRQYVLREVIGVGRNGEVWLARDERAGRDVVLKPVRVAGDDRSAVARLRALPRALDTFRDHPHLTALHAIHEKDGRWLVMEHVPGVLDLGQPMSPGEAARLGAHIADALEALHAAGIVHCDIRPAAVGLTRRGHAKLLDYGAAFQWGGHQTLAVDSPISYTPDYAAPEVARGIPLPPSDVFCLGMTLYALVTGFPPRRDERGVVALDREAVGLLHGALQEMLQLDARDRPDAAEAKRLLTAVANGIPARGRAPAVDRPAPRPTAPRPTAARPPGTPDPPLTPPTAPPSPGPSGAWEAPPSPPPQAPPPVRPAPDAADAPRRPREWLVVVAGAVALAVIAGGLVWFTGVGGDAPSVLPEAGAQPDTGAGPDAGGRPDAGPGPDAGPPPSPQPDGGPQGGALVGDQRTADPCALTDRAALDRFGYTDLDNDYGNFDRCDVLVSPEDDLWVDVEVSFTEHAHIEGELREPMRVRHVGEIRVAEAVDEPDDCDRAVLLPGDDSETAVWVSASTDDEGSPALCEMADAAALSAAEQLDSLVRSGEQIPRRSPPPALPEESLVWQDACGLLDADALAAVPGVDAAEPKTHFGAWQCDWSSQNGKTFVGLTYDRGEAMSEDDDTTAVAFGDRSGFLRPEGNGPGTCSAYVEHRDYADEYDETAVERVLIWVEGEDRTPDELCDWASDLAASAAGRLPAT